MMFTTACRCPGACQSVIDGSVAAVEEPVIEKAAG